MEEDSRWNDAARKTREHVRWSETKKGQRRSWYLNELPTVPVMKRLHGNASFNTITSNRFLLYRLCVCGDWATSPATLPLALFRSIEMSWRMVECRMLSTLVTLGLFGFHHGVRFPPSFFYEHIESQFNLPLLSLYFFSDGRCGDCCIDW